MNQYKCNKCGYIGYDPREPDAFEWDFIINKCPQCKKGRMVYMKAI